MAQGHDQLNDAAEATPPRLCHRGNAVASALPMRRYRYDAATAILLRWCCPCGGAKAALPRRRGAAEAIQPTTRTNSHGFGGCAENIAPIAQQPSAK